MVKERGFTLIEMALVVAILGLLVGGGAFALTPLLRQAKINTTNTALDQLEAALALFAIRNDRLPCPADGSLQNTNANYGIEPAATPTNGGNCATTLANSVIPWKTLGMDETYSIDGWGNRISYFPANGAIDPSINTLVDSSTGATAKCASDPTGVSCTLCLSRTTNSTSSTRATLCDQMTNPGGATTGLTPSFPYANYIAVYSISGGNSSTELTSAQPAAITTATQAASGGLRAAYVLISHGQTGWYGWTKGGTQLQPYTANFYTLKQFNSGSAAHLAGTANNLGFVQGTSQMLNNFSSANYFDDIVRWRSPGFVIVNCGSGACGNP